MASFIANLAENSVVGETLAVELARLQELAQVYGVRPIERQVIQFDPTGQHLFDVLQPSDPENGYHNTDVVAIALGESDHVAVVTQ